MAKVLNGDVEAGDRVAYATRESNHGAIHMGEVTEVVVRETDDWRGARTVTKLKIRVEISSGWGKVPRTSTVGELNRVVKL